MVQTLTVDEKYTGSRHAANCNDLSSFVTILTLLKPAMQRVYPQYPLQAFIRCKKERKHTVVLIQVAHPSYA
jgi:hypothetical protein